MCFNIRNWLSPSIWSFSICFCFDINRIIVCLLRNQILTQTLTIYGYRDAMGCSVSIYNYVNNFGSPPKKLLI